METVKLCQDCKKSLNKVRIFSIFVEIQSQMTSWLNYRWFSLMSVKCSVYKNKKRLYKTFPDKDTNLFKCI